MVEVTVEGVVMVMETVVLILTCEGSKKMEHGTLEQRRQVNEPEGQG